MSQPTSEGSAQSAYSIPESEHTSNTGNTGNKKVTDKARRFAEDAKERAGGGLGQAKRRASESYARARSEAARAYEDSMTSVRSSFQQHPLAYAFGAFAAGVLVGMLLPTTRAERRAFSPAAERVREKGEKMASQGQEAMDEATQAAERKIRGEQ